MKKCKKCIKLFALFTTPVLASASILSLTSCSSDDSSSSSSSVNSNNPQHNNNPGNSGNSNTPNIVPEDKMSLVDEGNFDIEKWSGYTQKSYPKLLQIDYAQNLAWNYTNGNLIKYEVSIDITHQYYMSPFDNVRFQTSNDPKQSFATFEPVSFKFQLQYNGNDFILEPISENLKLLNGLPYKNYLKNEILLPLENQYYYVDSSGWECVTEVIPSIHNDKFRLGLAVAPPESYEKNIFSNIFKNPVNVDENFTTSKSLYTSGVAASLESTFKGIRGNWSINIIQ